MVTHHTPAIIRLCPQKLLVLLLILLAGGQAMAAGGQTVLQLEERLESIDQQLKQLARYTPDGNLRAIGYRSQHHNTPQHPEWIEVTLGETTKLDEVVLIPCIRRDENNQLQPDAFPLQFRLIAGRSDDRNGRLIAEFIGNASLAQGIAPLIIPCDEVEASWIRVEVPKLPKRAFDQRYAFQLAEIMAFRGKTNLALHQPVQTSSASQLPAWSPRYATDGFIPYLMNAAGSGKSVAYLHPVREVSPPQLTIDLGQSLPISQINLHAIDLSDSLPQTFASNFGIPEEMIVLGATRSDFSDAVTLFELQKSSIYETGPIMNLPFPITDCRYIQLKIIKPTSTALYGGFPPKIGFAEIEVLADGENVAKGKTVTANFRQFINYRPLESLTDGLNIYGKILPLREWMGQLAERHKLESERPAVVKELALCYARQKNNLQRMSWMVAALGAGIFISILVNWIMRMRHVTKIKERFAVDLHDELGANLHAIKMLGDLAEDTQSPTELKALLDRSRNFAKRSIKAVRYCTNTLAGRGFCKNLPEDMQHSADRLLADIEHHLSFEGEAFLENLSPRKRVDLFFFFKESLSNIIRHSGATRVDAKLKVTPQQLTLRIHDNGLGLQDGIPASLKRRNRLLKGKLAVSRPPKGGTQITLNLKLQKWKILK